MAASHIQKIQNVKALMIQITRKEACCGCEACVQICPKACISLKEDEEGFWYPHVDVSKCVDCKLCEQVCPVLHQEEPTRPLHIYAAKNKNEEIRLNSSSGGIFTLLAEDVLRRGGVVFGARFNQEWNVVHAYVQREEELADFRGSKYVQSRIGDAYRSAESFLKAGREVMFVGAPCQIRGLKLYLRKDYPNLLAVDFVCHGVPSPKMWRTYLNEIIAHQGDGKNSVLSHPVKFRRVERINFRSKSKGWKKYSFALTLSEATAEGEKNTVLLSSVNYENAYMKAFLDDLCLRPSCYHCPCKRFKSRSDLTLGDYWWIGNVDVSFDDDKGCSIVYANSDKGDMLLRKTEAEMFHTDSERDIKEAYLFEGAVSYSARKNKNRAAFFEGLGHTSFEELAESLRRKKTKREWTVDWLKAGLKKAGVFRMVKGIYKSMKYYGR